MIASVIVLGCVLIVYICVSTRALYLVIMHARDERRELEDRLMAMANPNAVILHKAQENNEPATVTYVDDEKRDPEWGMGYKEDDD